MRLLLAAALAAGATGLQLLGEHGPAGELRWPLFPRDQVPGERPGYFGTEVHAPPDPSDPMGKKCAPGETSGVWFHNVSEPTLVPFLVKPGSPNRQNITVIILPGGGFSFLAWTKEGMDVARWLNSNGISAFVLKYRVPGRPWLRDLGEKHLAARMDIQRALSMVRQQAPSLGLDPSRIGLMGFSAGGILSTEVAGSTKRLYQRIDEVDDASPHPDFQILVYAAGDPKYTKRRRQPPTFLAIAQDDQCVDLSLALNYFAALRKNAPPSELHVYPDGRHGFGLCTGDYPTKWYEACTWTNQTLLFMQQQILNGQKVL